MRFLSLPFAAAAFIFTAAMSFAQTPLEPKREIVLTVNAEEIDVLGRALGNLPYATVAPLMAKLQMQIIAQQKVEEEKAKAAKK